MTYRPNGKGFSTTIIGPRKYDMPTFRKALHKKNWDKIVAKNAERMSFYRNNGHKKPVTLAPLKFLETKENG